MMDIKSHGDWQRYTPHRLPEGAPPNAMFSRRIGDGVDWYDYVNPPKDNRQRLFSENFREDSVKIAFMFHEYEQKWKIGPSVIDATLIFPPNHFVREIIDFGTTDEDEIIARLRNRFIDPDSNEITEPPPPPQLSSEERRVSENMLAVVMDLMARMETLEKKLA